jgi:hypothetical protein
VNGRRQIRDTLLLLVHDGLAHEPDAILQPREPRYDRKRKQREAPVEHEHGNRRHDDHARVPGSFHGSVRNERLQAADVAGNARLDFARTRVREERQRQVLQMPIYAHAQVVQDGLPDAGRHEGLNRARDGGGGRDGDQYRDQSQQKTQIALRERFVDDAANDERSGHAGNRGEQHQRRHDGELQRIGLEKRENSAQVSMPRSMRVATHRIPLDSEPTPLVGTRILGCSSPRRMEFRWRFDEGLCGHHLAHHSPHGHRDSPAP